MKKKFLYLLSILVLFTINTNVEAKESFYQVDNNLSVEDEFDGTVLFAGETVSTKSQIEGIAFVAGNSVEVSGKVDYGFLVGNSIKITGTVDNDLFVAGSNITVDKDAYVARDAYLVASTIDIDGAKFNRNIKLSASKITLSDVTIVGDVYIAADTINLEDNVVIEGTLSYNEDANIEGIDENEINAVDTYEMELSQSATLISKMKNKLFSIISGFILLVLMFLMFPSLFKKIDNKLSDNKLENYLAKIGIGFIGLIIIPIISIASICTVIGMPIGFTLIALYMISLYFGTLITAYVVGNKLYTLGFKKEYNFYSIALIGLVVISLLKLIPVVSGFVGFFGLLFGLGMIICLFIKDRK